MSSIDAGSTTIWSAGEDRQVLAAHQRVETGGVAVHADARLGGQPVEQVEAGLDDAERVLELVLGTGEIQFAVGDVGDEVGSAFQVGCDMRREQDAALAVLDGGGEDVHQLVAGEHVQAAGRFVQDQQTGVVAQCHGQHELHLHAAGELLDLLAAVQAESPEVAVEDLMPPGAVHAAHDAFDLVDAPGVHEVAGIEDHAELLLDGLLVGDRVQAEDLDLAGVAADHVQDQLDERGLAGAVRADQAHDVAGGQVKGDVFQREAGIVVFGRARDGQRHRWCGGHDWSL